jgi:adenylate kinase family enzyme
VLLDAEELQAGSHEIKDWLENVNDAIYDADNLLDDFSTESLWREIMARGKQAKKVCVLFSKSNQIFYALKMGHKIKEIREKLASYEANRRFLLEVHHGETRLRNKERDDTHSFLCAEEVIGREDDKKAVIEQLVESNVGENVSILSIVGIGGLGKTTLAQLIFNDEKIQHF